MPHEATGHLVQALVGRVSAVGAVPDSADVAHDDGLHRDPNGGVVEEAERKELDEAVAARVEQPQVVAETQQVETIEELAEI